MGSRYCIGLFALALLAPICTQSLAQVPESLAQEIERYPAERISFTGGGKFVTGVHRKLTPTETACARDVNAAIYLQDFLQQQRSAAHFDNCAFDEGFEYLQSLLADAERAFVSVGDVAQPGAINSNEFRAGMISIGQALHAVQDFYAHTNYVELSAQDQALIDGRTLPIVRLWTNAGKQQLVDLRARGLVSGTWRIGWPKRCTASALSHDALNKDSDTATAGLQPIPRWGMTAYQAAFGTAQRASLEFFIFAANKWPVIPKVCGEEIDYITAPELRAKK